jgi:hypothetical protein
MPKGRAARAHHSVYVIELDEAVWTASARFRKANPRRERAKPCVYVGLTGLAPEERFAKHKVGIRANTFVQRYGRRLRPDLFPAENPMPYAQGQRMEVEVARVLRGRGYGVWQN